MRFRGMRSAVANGADRQRQSGGPGTAQYAAPIHRPLVKPCGHRVGRADKVETVVVSLGSELPEGLAGTPLLEFVERPGLAVGGQVRQRLIELVAREVDIGDLADAGNCRLDEPWLIDHVVVPD